MWRHQYFIQDEATTKNNDANNSSFSQQQSGVNTPPRSRSPDQQQQQHDQNNNNNNNNNSNISPQRPNAPKSPEQTAVDEHIVSARGEQGKTTCSSVRKAVRTYPEPADLEPVKEVAIEKALNESGHNLHYSSQSRMYQQQPFSQHSVAVSPAPKMSPVRYQQEQHIAAATTAHDTTTRTELKAGDIPVELEREGGQKPMHLILTPERKRAGVTTTASAADISVSALSSSSAGPAAAGVQQKQPPEWIAAASSQRTTLNAMLQKKRNTNSNSVPVGGIPVATAGKNLDASALSSTTNSTAAPPSPVSPPRDGTGAAAGVRSTSSPVASNNSNSGSAHPPYVNAFRRELDDLRSDMSSIQTTVRGLDSKIERMTGDLFSSLEGQLSELRQTVINSAREAAAAAAGSNSRHPQHQQQQQQQSTNNTHISSTRARSPVIDQQQHHLSPAKPLAVLASPLPERITGTPPGQQPPPHGIASVPLSAPMISSPSRDGVEVSASTAGASATGHSRIHSINIHPHTSANQPQQSSNADIARLCVAVEQLQDRVDVIAMSTSSAISSLASAISVFSAASSKQASAEAEKIARRGGSNSRNNDNNSNNNNNTSASSLL